MAETTGVNINLEDVLDPSANKMFAMADHLLSFSGSGDDGTNNLFSITDSDGSFLTDLHVGPEESAMDPFINNYLLPVTAEFNAIVGLGGSFGTGVGIESQDGGTNASGPGVGALEIATLLNPTSNADPSHGISAISILTNDTGAHNVGVQRGLYCIANHFATGTLADVEGVFIDSPQVTGGAGPITSATAIRIGDQAAATSNWAIKTGLGLVELGDALKVHGDLGFFAGTPAAKQTVTGSKGANAALANLLTALAAYGLLTDSTS